MNSLWSAWSPRLISKRPCLTLSYSKRQHKCSSPTTNSFNSQQLQSPRVTLCHMMHRPHGNRYTSVIDSGSWYSANFMSCRGRPSSFCKVRNGPSTRLSKLSACIILHDDIIWLQLPECFEARYTVFLLCEESLVRDTNLHYKDCSEVHSGSCSQMTSSCICTPRIA